jgi:hypothetical protein
MAYPFRFTDQERREILQSAKAKCEGLHCGACGSAQKPEWLRDFQRYNIDEKDEKDELFFGENESGGVDDNNNNNDWDGESLDDFPMVVINSYVSLDVAGLTQESNGKFTQKPLEQTIPTVCLVCRQCGYVMLFSSRILCGKPKKQ